MQEKLDQWINWVEYDELREGRHNAPHNILGLHDFGKGQIFTVYRPEAKAVTVTDMRGNHPTELEEVEPGSGFFGKYVETRKKLKAPYLLNIKYGEDDVVVTADPYCFAPQISSLDLYLFAEGKHYQIFDKLGAHPMEINGVKGTYFAVWAPHARAVSVVGNFNMWDGRLHPMRTLEVSGVYELFIPGVEPWAVYKYQILTRTDEILMKADPYANCAELRPNNASVVADLRGFRWTDRKWMTSRRKETRDSRRKEPMAIYEVHPGSWRKKDDGTEDGFYNYRELAVELAAYVKEMGYTHVELMGIAEHPFDGSWGYQVTGYYAPTRRYGSPEDFMYFVDYMHSQGISVILDWVPAHFPKDAHGLAQFDGQALYEHPDKRRGEHPHWGTLIYNYGRPQVSNYLIANALFWVEKYHADGIRMDAVASMLYLDYGKQDGEWIPNMYGGNENLEAIELIKHFNSILKKRDPGVLSIAEESTAFPMITGSLEEGGLGFDLKWNMGFMNDYLDYIKYDPYFRSHHHGELTFSMIYAYSEKFMLVFSHDEVVHGKGTLLGKMPGDRAQKLANLRLTYGYMMTQPGKKLLFMGQDLAEEKEWNEMRQVEWALQEQKENAGVQRLVKDLNALYRENKALYECDDQAKGFQWMNEISANECYVSFVRKGEAAEEMLLVVANFSGVPREITTGVPYEGKYKEILNTDAVCYGGTGVVNDRMKRAEDLEWDDKSTSVTVKLAPLSLSILQFIPYTEAELEKVIEKRIRKNTPIRKTTNKTAKKKQEK